MLGCSTCQCFKTYEYIYINSSVSDFNRNACSSFRHYITGKMWTEKTKLSGEKRISKTKEKYTLGLFNLEIRKLCQDRSTVRGNRRVCVSDTELWVKTEKETAKKEARISASTCWASTCWFPWVPGSQWDMEDTRVRERMSTAEDCWVGNKNFTVATGHQAKSLIVLSCKICRQLKHVKTCFCL